MKRKLNPEVQIGDRIELFHMDDEISVPLGTRGTVTNVIDDPFDMEGQKLINVNWDNGSSLALLSNADRWIKIEENLTEADARAQADYFRNNEEIFDNFDWRFLREYLKKVQGSGIVNMFGASPLLYSGAEHIERYYGEDREDDEEFQAVMEDADTAKDKMIQGTIKYMENEGLEVDVDSVNRYIRRLSNKILELYMLFY
jgi:hypothetical protein